MKRTCAAVAALLTTLALVGCGKDAQHGAGSGRQQDFSQADMDFAIAMQGHHQQAIRMASMVHERSDHPKIEDLAQQITRTQAPEVDLFARWIRTWAKRGATMPAHTHESVDHGPGTMSDAAMMRLDRSSGVRFDRMFLKMMIRHHAGAVEMAGTEIAKGESRGARTLAKEIKRSQADEIETMRRLLARL
ncbi:MAG: DUF305 domain-containing protein [Carbonactinosporaceae bacterium]